MKASEFKTILKNCKNADHWSDKAYDICGGEANRNRRKLHGILIEELLEKGYELWREDGYGGEDKGSEYWGVFSVKDTTEKTITYFQISGWYASYEGGDVDVWDFYEVEEKPVERYEWVQVNG